MKHLFPLVFFSFFFFAQVISILISGYYLQPSESSLFSPQNLSNHVHINPNPFFYLLAYNSTIKTLNFSLFGPLNSPCSENPTTRNLQNANQNTPIPLRNPISLLPSYKAPSLEPSHNQNPTHFLLLAALGQVS